MAQQWLDIVRLITAAGQGRHDDLENDFFHVWENHFPRFTLNNHFLQRLNERHRRLNEHEHQDQDLNQDLNQAPIMNCVATDPTTCTAWFTGQRFVPGIIRSGRPLMLDNDVYFEIEIISTVPNGAITIGLVPDDYPFGNQPGWQRGSIGYHADDGGIFIEEGRACKLKDKCDMGDRMGCGIELTDGRQFVYFTRNGHTVAEQPFETGRMLYPAIGMNSPGEKVKLCDSHFWDLPAEDGQVGMLPWKDPQDVNEELDLTVIPQTGHISFYWNKDGFRDILIPAPISFSRNKAFFEIEIFAFGENENISIGFVPKDYPQSRHPGWLPNSVGFHVAQGQFFTGQPHPLRGQVEKLSVGDKIGCGLEHNPAGARTIYFTKNGKAFLEEEVVLPDVVFPAVGIRSAGRTVSLCVQDCDTWGYVARNPRPGTTCASGSAKDPAVCVRQSAIEVIADAGIAQLNEVKGQTTTATLMAVRPFSRDLSYFEIEILTGESIIVGAVPRDYDLSELPGCHDRSVAYHSDDGGIYSESGRTSVFLQRCSHGDTVSCGISDNSNELQRIFFFAVNHQTLWEVPFGDNSQLLYPAIGMKSEGGPAQVLLQETSIWKAPAPVASASSSSASVSSSGCSALSETASGGAALVPTDPPKREAQNPVDMIRKELECAICWSILVQPKLFPCQKHSFCLACLRNHAAGIEPQGKICCPVCRKETRLPRRGVEDFQDNVSIRGLLDIVKKVPV